MADDITDSETLTQLEQKLLKSFDARNCETCVNLTNGNKHCGSQRLKEIWAEGEVYKDRNQKRLATMKEKYYSDENWISKIRSISHETQCLNPSEKVLNWRYGGLQEVRKDWNQQVLDDPTIILRRSSTYKKRKILKRLIETNIKIIMSKRAIKNKTNLKGERPKNIACSLALLSKGVQRLSIERRSLIIEHKLLMLEKRGAISEFLLLGS